jgi:phytoene dehydrogenase-like protein
VADKDYDVVIIGGGHHGTIIAPYLAKAGMTVGVFERQDRLGGGVTTEIGPVPRFKQDFCAHNTRFYAHPAFKDFDLYNEGLRYVAPETGTGIVFDDGSSFTGYPAWVLTDPKTGKTEFSEENVKKTYDQIAQFSRTDAETYLDLTEKAKTKWGPAFGRHRYSLPKPYGERGPFDELFADPESGLEPVMQFMTVKQLARYFFESPELRILFLRNAITSYTCQMDDVMGIGGLFGTLTICLSWSPPSIAEGGSQTLTDSLVSAGKKLGVEYFINIEVEKIQVENDVARGVTLKDGSRIEAKRLVVSDVGIPQLMFSLLGEEYVSDKLRRRLEATIYDRSQLLWGHVALHELPQYIGAESNPDVNRTYRLYWAPKDLAYFEDRYWHEICLMGFSSRLNVLTEPDTLWDPSRAAEGKHNVWTEDISCPLRYFSYREWRGLRDEYVANQLLPQWREYAPNMTEENIIGTRIYTPLDLFETDPDMIEGSFTRQAHIISQNGSFRGLPGFVGYRTAIKNLYACSSSLPGGQGIARGSSYHCYRVIAEDFGLPRVWEERGF